MEEGNEDAITAVNDLREDTRKELDNIDWVPSQLAEKQNHIKKQTEHRPIGFTHYKENNESVAYYPTLKFIDSFLNLFWHDKDTVFSSQSVFCPIFPRYFGQNTLLIHKWGDG